MGPREGFWPVGPKEVPDCCPSPADTRQGLPSANLLVWHRRPCPPEPSSCSSQHVSSVPSSCFLPGPAHTTLPVSSPSPTPLPSLKTTFTLSSVSELPVILYSANSSSSVSELLVPLSPEFLQQCFSDSSLRVTERARYSRLLGPPRESDVIGLRC